jgi:hypothetical protein
VACRVVVRQRPRNKQLYNTRCYVMAATDMRATTEELLETMFSVWSVRRLYNEGQLPLKECFEKAKGRVGGWCKMAASLVAS